MMNKQTKADQPAYGYGFTTANGVSHVDEPGLTKRELFAAMFTSSLISRNTMDISDSVYDGIKAADLLIEALNK